MKGADVRGWLAMVVLAGLGAKAQTPVQTPLQDPMRPTPVAAAPTPLTGSKSPARDRPQALGRPPEGRLSVLVLHTSAPVAMVDGVLVRPGGRLGAWRITALSEQGMDLHQGPQTHHLASAPGVVKTMAPPMAAVPTATEPHLRRQP